MLELVNVTKFYTSHGITNKGLSNINLKLSKNEIVAIVGESGSGKSTLLNVISKIDTFDEGEIYYKGNDTSYFSVDDMDHFRKNKIGFIFQNYNIIDSYTVLKNVMLPMIINGVSVKEAKYRATEIITKVGLKDRIKHRGTKLSGGEKQRCVIARALASNCEILACDEPTGNLDSNTSRDIINLIKEVAQDKLVLIVTHNIDEVKDIATRIIRIHDGEIVEDSKNDVEIKENVELNLDYVPVKQSINLKVAFDNLISTPKRTIFTLGVFFFISFFALFLFQLIMGVLDESYYSGFSYKGDNKLIVYDKNNEKLDIEKISKLSDKIVINPFYEQTTLYCQINDSQYYYSYNIGYEKYPKNLKLDGGRMPENKYECILLIPYDYYFNESEILDKDISIGEKAIEKYKITGYQIREDVNEYTFTSCDRLEYYYRITALSRNSNVTFSLDLNSKTKIQSYNDSLTMTTLTYSGYDLIDLTQYEIENSGYSYHIVAGLDFFEDLKENPYEVSIYGNKEKLKKEIAKLGYGYIDVSTYTNLSEFERFLTKIGAYVLIIASAFGLFFIYFITSMLLVKIYRTKIKDYSIFRTLGITKNDMRLIVVYEVLYQSVGTAIVVYIGTHLLSLTNIKMFSIFEDFYPFVGLIYFISILLIGLFTLNKKLFKSSVNKSPKAGDNND